MNKLGFEATTDEKGRERGTVFINDDNNLQLIFELFRKGSSYICKGPISINNYMNLLVVPTSHCLLPYQDTLQIFLIDV